MTTQTIYCIDGSVLYTYEAETLREAVEQAVKVGVSLTGAILTGANLTDANLIKANLIKANLTGANLSGATLTDAYLSWANLWGASLEGASLRGANLVRANLRGANLRDADLEEAILSGAVLTDANLIKANLNGADLEGAKLTDAATQSDGPEGIPQLGQTPTKRYTYIAAMSVRYTHLYTVTAPTELSGDEVSEAAHNHLLEDDQEEGVTVKLNEAYIVDSDVYDVNQR